MSTDDITAYNQKQPAALSEVCDLLMGLINSELLNAAAKLYHANPVWFIDENPIVGYDVSPERVNVLFWSGQSFDTPGLKPAGKFKAAGMQCVSVSDIDIEQLRKWLDEAKTVQWNYRDLRKNNGELVALDD